MESKKTSQIKIVNPILPKYEDVEKGFRQILESKNITTNKYTEMVEEKVKKIHGCKYCLVTSSGTTAFMLLLKAIERYYRFNGIVMQDFTWKSTKDIAEWLYGKDNMSYCDIDKDTWLAEDYNGVDSLFIPNMTFGNVKTYSYKKTLYDSTHCFGNKICNGRGFGEIISFSPAKLITGCEGGCIITNNKKIYEEAKRLRRYHGRMSELNACVLLENIKNLNKRKIEMLESDIDYCTSLFSTDGWNTWGYGVKSINLWDMTPNVIVYTHPNMTAKKREYLERYVEIKQRFKPCDKLNVNSKWVYDHMIMLPVLKGKKQKELIKILERVVK